MIKAVVLYGPKAKPRRKWMAFAALPRPGDDIREVGRVESVYWMRRLEGGDDDKDAAPDDRIEVHYPFIRCDDSSP